MTPPLVSVIVPIYNTAPFLGYCLNSLLRQTHTHWQGILVDDGSTDGSGDIARSYARLDSRFQVISIPNSGVSTARNVGLKAARGDYLHFLDSDDVLAPETLERQVAAAKAYSRQLVVSDVLIVDFTSPELWGPRLSAKHLQAKPAVLSKEEFRSRRMELIWHTALLEGLYGKLYDRRLWERLQLRFPEQLSLGEDFVTNLQYYAACNGVVFLQQIGHYYNNILGSDSLTHKYRPDLFETKMYLMERLWEHLHTDNSPTQGELVCYDNYVASTGLYCVHEVITSPQHMGRQQRRRRLREICGSPLFRGCLARASYIPQNYAHYRPLIQKERIGKLLRHRPPQQHPTTAVNRLLRCILRILRPLSGKYAPRLTALEQSLAHHGIRYTLSHRRKGP